MEDLALGKNLNIPPDFMWVYTRLPSKKRLHTGTVKTDPNKLFHLK